MAERVIRTLRERMERHITENKLLGKDEKWTQIIAEITKDYNDSVHSAIGMTPRNASKTENQGQLEDVYAKRRLEKATKPKYKVGDYIRLYKWKGRFTKGSKANFTREIFKIIEVLPTTPPTYRICDKAGEEIKGSVYAEEMVKSNVEEFECDHDS